MMNNSKSHSTNAIPFVSYQEGQGFTLSSEAEEFLNSLPEGRQIGVVSIVGKYRTGKSFFVNRVLLDQKKGGFQVGPTINPCTKGLWLWKKTVPSSSNSNMDIIMIDTEGFGGMDENTNHDSRIFLFSLLLSSYFIYNSVGSIDENALSCINLILNLAKQIQTKAHGKVGEDVSSFPAFLWVVRDFALMLQDKYGNRINSKQYLQNALELQQGNSNVIQNKNKIRRHLKHFFQERDCQLMVRPTEHQKDLQRLDQIDNTMLRPEFVHQVQGIRSKILSKVRPKKINDKALNGAMLVSLCKGYMEAINKGHVPSVESAWFYVCRSEGLKAIKEASDFLDHQIEQILKSPLKTAQMQNLKASLRDSVIARFKRKSLGSEQSHPDLLQKLERRVDDCLDTLNRKNKARWQDRYRQLTDKMLQGIKQKIYRQQYEDFSDFVRQFEMLKDQYDIETEDGDSHQKWKYFNQISENLHRLAGETITTKMTQNLNREKALMQQKMQEQQQQLEQKQRKLLDDKQQYRTKIENLEKENKKLLALQDSHKNRVLQYKTQHDKIYEKYRVLVSEHQQLQLQVDKLKRENKRQVENDMEETRGELSNVRSTLEKERALHEMEKKYIEEELDRYKERACSLENQCRKLRTSNAKLTSELQQIDNKYEEKKEEADILVQTNSSLSKKVETLLAENSVKNQLVGDHSEWMLEKSYLQNQVSFLKNTLSENKRLHDALLVALQQSLSSSESESNAQLMQANKNLSSALQKMQARCRVLQQKYDRVRSFKKTMKSCLTLQCANCTKHIQAHLFAGHLEQCLGNSMSSLKDRVYDNNRQSLHIAVSQTVVKDDESRKKPYTQYKIQLTLGELKWKVSKRYKQFSQLQQMLINRYPSIRYPASCTFLVDINNLMASKQKNIMAEERRKNLQTYLRDLARIQDIRNSDIFKHFLEIDQASFARQQYSEKKQRLMI